MRTSFFSIDSLNDFIKQEIPIQPCFVSEFVKIRHTFWSKFFSSSRDLQLSRDGISWTINIISPGNYVFNRQVNYILRMIEILVLCSLLIFMNLEVNGLKKYFHFFPCPPKVNPSLFLTNPALRSQDWVRVWRGHKMISNIFPELINFISLLLRLFFYDAEGSCLMLVSWCRRNDVKWHH